MSFFSFQDIIACITGIMVLVTLLLALELCTRKQERGPDAELVNTLREVVAAAKAQKQQVYSDLEDGNRALARLAGGRTVTRGQVANARKTVHGLEVANKTLDRDIQQAVGQRDDANAALVVLTVEVAALGDEVKREQEILERLLRQTPVTIIRQSGSTKKALWVECGVDQVVVGEVPKTGPDAMLAKRIDGFRGQDAYQEFLAWAKGRDRTTEYFVLLIRPESVSRWKPTAEWILQNGFKIGWDIWPAGMSLFANP